jgi:hypothetical protein
VIKRKAAKKMNNSYSASQLIQEEKPFGCILQQERSIFYDLLFKMNIWDNGPSCKANLEQAG